MNIDKIKVAERISIRNSVIPIMDNYVLLVINTVFSQSAPIMYTNINNSANSGTKDANTFRKESGPICFSNI